VDFVAIEDRVDRPEGLFGQFMTEMAVLNKRADEREKRAEEGYAEAFAEKLEAFATFYPQYAHLKRVGIFASWSMPTGVAERLTERGIYCLQRGEETMDLTNAGLLER